MLNHVKTGLKKSYNTLSTTLSYLKYLSPYYYLTKLQRFIGRQIFGSSFKQIAHKSALLYLVYRLIRYTALNLVTRDFDAFTSKYLLIYIAAIVISFRIKTTLNKRKTIKKINTAIEEYDDPLNNASTPITKREVPPFRTIIPQQLRTLPKYIPKHHLLDIALALDICITIIETKLLRLNAPSNKIPRQLRNRWNKPEPTEVEYPLLNRQFHSPTLRKIFSQTKPNTN